MAVNSQEGHEIILRGGERPQSCWHGRFRLIVVDIAVDPTQPAKVQGADIAVKQFLAQRDMAPGKASGYVYGVSTLGNIAGVMLTTFVLIPSFPVSTLLYVWLAVAIVSLAFLLRLLRAPTSP